MSHEPIRSIAIIGDGIVGLSAASAFARALPQMRVTVVGTEADPAALADVLPGSTSGIHRFHAAIGLDEAQLFRSGAALPRIALRFEDWGADADPWFHVDGEHGQPAGTIAFHHYWARARRSGSALSYHLYAVAGALAEAGKFIHPEPRSGSPLSTFDYGLRLDPRRYRELLAAHADALRVERPCARFGHAEQHPDMSIAALALADGTRVEADLFVDASGPAARLSSLLDTAWEAWDGYYPCRSLTMHELAPAAPSPVDTIRRLSQGWACEAPLLDRTIAITLSPGRRAVRLRLGRRPRPWTRNLLAIGDAAVALDPLHWFPLHAAHEGILRALELLPGRDCHPLETGEYNRRTLLATDRLRDFQLLHHRAARWDTLPASPDLAHMLQQFEARGRLPGFDEDSLTREMWLAALLGLGILPRAMDPLADTVPDDVAERGMAELAELAPLVRGLPDYRAYLTRVGAERAASPIV